MSELSPNEAFLGGRFARTPDWAKNQPEPSEDAPVVFANPITGKLEFMPAEMVSAYVPYESYLDLESAARAATIRDQEAADNLLLSIVECTQPEIVMIPEGTQVDLLAIEPPSTR